MRCFDGFFMGNSLSDPRDLLIPFLGKFERPPPAEAKFLTEKLSPPLDRKIRCRFETSSLPVAGLKCTVAGFVRDGGGGDCGPGGVFGGDSWSDYRRDRKS